MKPTPPALLLSRADLAAILTLEDCIVAVEAAFAAHARGDSLLAGILHGEGVGGEFHIKSGGLQKPRALFSTKINGGFFQNPSREELPAIQGLIVLQDAQNGVPLAVMESGLITRLRTAAATAVAAKYLSALNASTATICGAGTQAAAQLRALLAVRKLRRVFIWSRDANRAGEFARAQSSALHLEIVATSDLATAARQSEIVVTCTPARKWFLGREQVLPGAFVAAVGADSPDKQELEPELLAAAAVVTDLTSQSRAVGDLHHAIAAGLMQETDVRAELGDIIIGKAAGRKAPEEILVFDSTGTALQDVAAAALAWERAVESGRGIRFAFWG